MPIVGHNFFRLAARGSFIGTVTANFPPSGVVAQASLNYTLGGGTQKVGIVSFRFRPTPDGAEQQVNFGGWPNWPATVNADRMTSVTFGVASGSNQELDGIGNVFFWA